jgi:hypothetical protein
VAGTRFCTRPGDARFKLNELTCLFEYLSKAFWKVSYFDRSFDLAPLPEPAWPCSLAGWMVIAVA